METIRELIRLKSPQGIPYDEAVQLLVWIYVSVDILPHGFRCQVWDRARLITEFEQMGTESLIKRDVSERCFRRHTWSKVLDDFLGGKIMLDETFPARADRYV